MRSRTPSAWLVGPRVCRRSAWRRFLSPLFYCLLQCPAAAPGAAAAVAERNELRGAAARDAAGASAPLPRPIAACAGDVRLFLELSVIGLLTVGLLLGASHCCRRLRRQVGDRLCGSHRAQQQGQDKAATGTGAPPWVSTSRFEESTGGVHTWRRRILCAVARAVAAAAMAAWGVAGLVFAASTRADAAEAPQRPALHEPCGAWESGAAVAVGCCCLLAAFWLLATLVVDALTTSLIRPPSETPAALRCFRCSCCSFALSRALVLLPLAALATLAARSWIRTRLSAASDCEPRLVPLFAGAALVFGLMTATAAAVILASALGVCRHRREPSGASTRRRPRLAVASTLAALALAAVAWGVLGLVWLSPSGPRGAPSCGLGKETAAAVDEAEVCVVALLVVGTALLMTTACCRLEAFLLATGATPTVDSLMLSPSLGAASRTERAIGAALSATAKQSGEQSTRGAAHTPGVV